MTNNVPALCLSISAKAASYDIGFELVQYPPYLVSGLPASDTHLFSNMQMLKLQPIWTWRII